MTAPGFCTCKRDFPQRDDFHPPENATWHFLCDKPVLPADFGRALLGPLTTAELGALDNAMRRAQFACATASGERLSLHPAGVLADLADVRREVNNVYPWQVVPEPCEACIGRVCHCDHPARARKFTPTGTGWPADPEPTDEAQRIAEVFDEARAELDRGL